ncbi:hypothetical protein SAMN02745164_01219 [Marinitoga hydrogenitolerans DSM 16785]|uniref:Uncharacterized protein n=1 Tax=Marinitoga hydrogenitolerans (strain DSM 16785 / JCM 12826 / AT1271) TaxID=1122195 RepID=A0A1M4WP96_MARH1|nr:hypothetical protein [Marinitoga hydrogenitolerans]SHE82873.1 hypothetical protein SAMN02745164_01219 [Marinitoga hydrogenitolerans DSM 16785]
MISENSKIINGKIIKIEKRKNSKYLYNIFIKDQKNNIYKTIINTRFFNTLNLNENISILGKTVKFGSIYKLLSRKIIYKGKSFDIISFH